MTKLPLQRATPKIVWGLLAFFLVFDLMIVPIGNPGEALRVLADEVGFWVGVTGVLCLLCHREERRYWESR